jgi:thymidylate kinase
MNGFLICIVGIDGSGKTTLSNKVTDLLTQRNVRNKQIYLGWRNFNSAPFKMIATLIKKGSGGSFNAADNHRVTTQKIKHAGFFKFAVMVDYCLTTISRMFIPLLTRTTVVCDRYFFDVLINTGVDLGESEQRICRSIYRWGHVFPKPALLILLDVPVEVAYERKDDIPAVDYLTEHRKIFLSLATKFGMIVLDGTRSSETLESVIRIKIDELLRN